MPTGIYMSDTMSTQIIKHGYCDDCFLENCSPTWVNGVCEYCGKYVCYKHTKVHQAFHELAGDKSYITT